MYLDVHVCIYVKEHVGLHSWMCELYICMWVCIFGCVEVHLCIVHMYVGVYVQVCGGACGHALLDVCKCVWECVGSGSCSFPAGVGDRTMVFSLLSRFITHRAPPEPQAELFLSIPSLAHCDTVSSCHKLGATEKRFVLELCSFSHEQSLSPS